MTAPTSTRSLLGRLDRLLDDAVMGALALVLIFAGLAPEVFSLSPSVQAAFDVLELGLVALFALEFAAALAAAPSRRSFLTNPWRLLDAAILIAAGVSFLPAMHDALRGSLALRLLRLGRYGLFGVRVGATLATRDSRRPILQSTASRPASVHVLSSGSLDSEEWPQALKSLAARDGRWRIFERLDAAAFAALAAALSVPVVGLQARLTGALFPRFDRVGRVPTLFLWFPTFESSGPVPRVRREPLLWIGGEAPVLIAGEDGPALREALVDALEASGGSPGLALLRCVVARYVHLCDGLEKAMVEMESGQHQLQDAVFLDRCFRLRAELSRVRGVLKHLRGALRDLAGEAPSGFGEVKSGALMALAADADELYDGIDDVLSSLIALVDLRLNIASFQMNKVMRLLAVLTTLTLVPTIVGGFLGMNIAGNPWPASLGQVVFGAGSGMALSLYIFAVKGWIR